MRDKKETGTIGEDLAADFLKKRGYKILARNLENNLGEIDILARYPAHNILRHLAKKSVIVVVEVKTKSGREFGSGFEMVNYFKRRKLILLAKSLLAVYPKQTIRIDVISIDTSTSPPQLQHFENAVEEH